jgi:CheY-like chemotaxis protein
MFRFRLLIVEDEEETLDEMQKLFAGRFPDAIVDVADTVNGGLRLIEQASDSRSYYDVAILDMKLPKDLGDNPEVDESLCQKVRDLMPHTLIIHYTAYPEDPQVSRHAKRVHTGPDDPRASIISKRDLGWSQDMLRQLKAYLYGARIERQMTLLFGNSDEVALQSHPRKSRGLEKPVGSLTHTIAALQRDIVVHWNDLDEKLQQKIRNVFYVDTDSDPIRISLIDPSSSESTG